MPINKHIYEFMLEQRRAQEKGYITLKEAAEFSNYSPDYIGQLIRAGKIKGEQVYSNVAWVTTVNEVEAYLQNKDRHVTELASRKFAYYQSFATYVLYVVIACMVTALLVLQYILYVSVDRKLSERNTERASEVEVVSIANPEAAF